MSLGENMDSSSGSEWLVVLLALIWFLIPLPFIIKRPPSGPNRFGEPARPLDFVAAVKAYFSNYFNFSGRASRSEFWWAILFNFIVSVVVSIVPLVHMVWTLCIFFPSITLAARRLHDNNRTGWLQLLAFFFPIGTIALIVWYATPPKETD